MIERIERTTGAVSVDLWFCVCEREACGWAWVVPYSRGVPSRCSGCKARNWNAGGQVQVLDVAGPVVSGLPATVRGKITTANVRPSTKQPQPTPDASTCWPYCLKQAGPNPSDVCWLLSGHDGRHNPNRPKAG